MDITLERTTVAVLMLQVITAPPIPDASAKILTVTAVKAAPVAVKTVVSAIEIVVVVKIAYGARHVHPVSISAIRLIGTITRKRKCI